MPPGRPIRKTVTFLDRFREFLRPYIVAVPPLIVNEPYVRASGIVNIPANSTVTMLTDKAPATLPLRLISYYLATTDQTAKDALMVTLLINGVKFANHSDSIIWVLSETQPVMLDVIVPPGNTWALVVRNTSGTPGAFFTSNVSIQMQLNGEIVRG